jgi:HK97 family phage prohead protease
MERAYSTLTITKAVAAERTVEGIASVPSVDRQGDIVESKGVRWRKDASGRPDVPWLYQHRHDSPIGRVEWLQAKPDGLRFKARMPKVDEPGPLKDRLDTAFQEIAAGLVRGISLGFMPLKAEPIETGWRFKEISLYEISSVTIPACEEACVEVVKRYDEAARRGEIPNDGSLWKRVAGTGLAALNEFDASPERKELGNVMGPVVSATQSTQAMMRALCNHVDSLERRLDEPTLAYAGVHQRALGYRRGQAVTHKGCLYIALSAAEPGDVPGESGSWQLAVRAGRDGKDAK